MSKAAQSTETVACGMAKVVRVPQFCLFNMLEPFILRLPWTQGAPRLDAGLRFTEQSANAM